MSALGLHYCAWAFSSCDTSIAYLLAAELGPLIAIASLVVEPGL